MRNESKMKKEQHATSSRLTVVRRLLIEVLSVENRPLAVQELLHIFAKKKHMVNKTTVYRQLASLVSSGIVEEVRLADRSVRYEIASKNHHHHLVCLRCEKIEDVQFDEDTKKQEKIIKKRRGFTVTQHVLEFFGVCASCSK